MSLWPRLLAVLGLGLALLGPADRATAQEPASSGIDSALCGLIDAAARDHDVPSGFLTRLIFQESSFRTAVTSPAGAQGVAQFMPGTARERGLDDPFDPEQAVPQAARFLAELHQRFGNWGLAAAAYNGGPARVAAWLAGRGGLFSETQAYVAAITGTSAQDWADDAKADDRMRPPAPGAATACPATVAAIRAGGGDRIASAATAPFAPWGVQLAGNFSKARALASFQRAAARQRPLIGAPAPMIIATRLRSRGTRAFYRVRLPAADRAQATALCEKIQAGGGACVVLKS